MRMRNVGIQALVLVAVLALGSSYALAQTEESHHHDDTFFDTTVGPLILPTTDDFVALDDTDGGTSADPGQVTTGVGIATYIDVSDQMKSGVVTPSYRFSPKLALKAHVPLIFSRTLTYWAGDASASGLGDITLDGTYTHFLGSGNALLRFSGSVKLPTGDDEATDEIDGTEFVVPLGTGTTDFLVKGQYAKTTPSFGFLGTLMYRKNSPSESYQDWGYVQVTNKVTAANELVASAFARKRVAQKWSVNLGLAMAFMGDGESLTEYSDGTPTDDWEANMGGTLVDLFPGLSYDLGKVKPYLGVRIPLATSYDNDLRDDERDMSFIFQFSYRPEKLGS